MKKILLVAGCSYSNERFTSIHHPELDVSWPNWPTILAKKLDMELINVSESGAGQEYIYSNIIDKLQTIDHSKIGLVIAAWSTAPRRDWQYEELHSKKAIWSNDMNDSKGYMIYWINRSLRYYYSFQSVCENLKLPYMQFQMLDLFKSYLRQEVIKRRFKSVNTRDVAETYLNAAIDFNPEEGYWKEQKEKEYLAHIHNSPYYEKINNNFIGWPTHSKLDGFCVAKKVLDPDTDRISELDRHPNKQGQRKIMEFLYEKILNSCWL